MNNTTEEEVPYGLDLFRRPAGVSSNRFGNP